MPQQIDWSGIRANAIILGVREAARRAAINLPDTEANRFVQRVLKRSARQGWITQKEEAVSQPPVSEQSKPMSANVLSGSDTLISKLKEDGEQTKLSLSKGVRKAAKFIEKQKGVLLFTGADRVKQIVASASLIHGWDEGKSSTGPTLNVLSIGGEMHISSSR